MIYHAKEDVIKVDGKNIDYITFGNGQKTLVMIQGLNTRGIQGSAVGLAWMYRIFAKDYRVYLFDRRPDVWEGITVRDFAKDLAMCMDALHLKKADVIGVSQGGMIGQYLALDRPDLVKKLVLAVTASKKNETMQNVIEHWIHLTKQGDMKALVFDMAEKMYSGDYVKKYKFFMPLLAMLQKPKDVQRFIILARSCLTCRAYEELEQIRCPVFVIGGRMDRIVGAEASLEIAEKLNCKSYMYENMGHAAYEEAKDFNEMVYEFLKSGN